MLGYFVALSVMFWTPDDFTHGVVLAAAGGGAAGAGAVGLGAAVEQGHGKGGYESRPPLPSHDRASPGWLRASRAETPVLPYAPSPA